MRKLTYYVAVSLDGFIAAPDGRCDFFLVEGDHMAELTARRPETVPTTWREAAGLAGAENKKFDTVVMGRTTYEAGVADGNPSPYSHMRQYVFSRTLAEAADPAVRVVSTDPLEKIRALKRQAGKDIWLCGGGSLAAALQPEIDELVLKINPVAVGSGVPLFHGGFQPVRYRLRDSGVFDSGVMTVTYART